MSDFLPTFCIWITWLHALPCFPEQIKRVSQTPDVGISVPDITGSVPDVSGDVSVPSVGGVDVDVAGPSVNVDAPAPSASIDLPSKCRRQLLVSCS